MSTVQTMNSPQIPPEILLAFVKHADLNTAKALSLTARLFLLDCRAKIFQNVYISCSPFDLKEAVDGLVTPHIAPHIQCLTLEAVPVPALDDGGFKNWRRGVLFRINQPAPHIYSIADMRMSMYIRSIIDATAGRLHTIVLRYMFEIPPTTRPFYYDGEAFFSLMRTVLFTTRLPVLKTVEVEAEQLRSGIGLWSMHAPGTSGEDIFDENFSRIENFKLTYNHGYLIESFPATREFLLPGNLRNLSIASARWYNPTAVRPINQGFEKVSNLASLNLERLFLHGKLSYSLEIMTSLKALRVRYCCLTEGEDTWEAVFVACMDLKTTPLASIDLRCLHYVVRNTNGTGAVTLGTSPGRDIVAMIALRDLEGIQGASNLDASSLGLVSCPVDHYQMVGATARQMPN